ncbi:MAG: UxaA family hydrolase [Hyphomicrobiales bacterium]|nr:UxaA family hydrolase [Hyphomicrobiales bacterium]
MSDPAQSGFDAIRLASADNVATVLRPVACGDTLRLRGAKDARLVASQDIPLCHKIALTALAAGDRVVKYGQTIGEATAAIRVGDHVHVHNMRSLRAARHGG